MNKNEKKGLLSKLIAMQEYALKGYYVYNEMNNTGPVDIIAINKKTKDIRLLEVKTKNVYSQMIKAKEFRGRRINRVLKPSQKELGVKMLYVDLKTKKVEEG